LAFYSGTNLVAFSTIATNLVVGGSGSLPGRSEGATFYAFDARVDLLGSILAGGAGSSNITGAHLDLGFNLCSDDSLSAAGDTTRTNVNPRLGPPAWNGGMGQTMALLPGSPALDGVSAGIPGLPAVDQRGVARPWGDGADIGAFELGPAGSPSVLAEMSGSNAVIRVMGDAGYAYRLWTCSDLSSSPLWTVVATNVARSNGPAIFALPSLTSRQFFRAEKM
jgi:hypothetical protein